MLSVMVLISLHFDISTMFLNDCFKHMQLCSAPRCLKKILWYCHGIYTKAIILYGTTSKKKNGILITERMYDICNIAQLLFEALYTFLLVFSCFYERKSVFTPGKDRGMCMWCVCSYH